MTEAHVDFGHIWHNTLTALDADGLPPTQRAFLHQAKFVGLLDQTALLAVPDEFTKDIIETRVRQQVVATLSSQLGKEIRLAVTVDPALRPENEAEPEVAADLANLTELEADESPDLGSPFSTFRDTTPNTRLTPSSSAPATASPTQLRSRSLRRRPRRTTRCSSMGSPDWARPTSCMRSATTRAISIRTYGCAT